jgi:hypothetical protein
MTEAIVAVARPLGFSVRDHIIVAGRAREPEGDEANLAMPARHVRPMYAVEGNPDIRRTAPTEEKEMRGQ